MHLLAARAAWQAAGQGNREAYASGESRGHVDAAVGVVTYMAGNWQETQHDEEHSLDVRSQGHAGDLRGHRWANGYLL